MQSMTEHTLSDETRAAIDMYIRFMHAIKNRIAVVCTLDKFGKEKKLPPFAVFDSAWLQLRTICEELAAACVAARSDLDDAEDAKESNWPRLIFKKLDQIDSDYFPVPMGFVAQGTDGKRYVEENPPYLDCIEKSQIHTLWKKCGRNLHTVSHKELVRGNYRQSQPKDIMLPLNRIKNLLWRHKLPLFREDRFAVIVQMNDFGTKIDWSIEERVADPSVVFPHLRPKE